MTEPEMTSNFHLFAEHKILCPGCLEYIAEIKRLRSALHEIASSGPVDSDGNDDAEAGWSWCYDVAAAALEATSDIGQTTHRAKK